MPDDSAGPATDVVQKLGRLFALAAGFIALVYIAGGAVLVVRLFLSDLPSRTVVGQLPRDLLISVGLAQIVIPALAVAAIYGIARLLPGDLPPPRRLVDEWNKPPTRQGWRVRLNGWSVLLATSAIPALVATGCGVWQIHRNVKVAWDDWKTLLIFLAPTFLLTLLVMMVALNLRARLAKRARRDAKTATGPLVRERWNERRAVVRMTFVVALASLPFCLAFAATINLLDARVCVTTGSAVRTVDGVLIGEASNRTYIGENGRRHPLHVFAIPQTQIVETIIGGKKRRESCKP